MSCSQVGERHVRGPRDGLDQGTRVGAFGVHPDDIGAEQQLREFTRTSLQVSLKFALHASRQRGNLHGDPSQYRRVITSRGGSPVFPTQQVAGWCGEISPM